MADTNLDSVVAGEDLTSGDDVIVGDDLNVTGLATIGETLGVTGLTTLTGGLAIPATLGLTTMGLLVKIEETVLYSAFTDGGSTVGTFDLTLGTIPAGATFLFAAVTAITGFANDTSAIMTIGDGTDVDRYNTSTANIFATAAAGISCGAPSGVQYHDAVKTPKLTVTTNADFTSVNAGSVTVELFYLT